jgi:putative membrane protein
MMWWYDDGTGWAGWLMMTVVMVAFWAAVIFAVVAIFRGTGESRGPSPQSDPLQILAQRFARGEIDEDEYHARSAVLRASIH